MRFHPASPGYRESRTLFGSARREPTTIALALAASSAVVGTVGAIQQANAASSADKFNQQVAQQNSVVAQQEGQSQLAQQQRSAYLQLGAQKAAYGASGVSSDGSPMDVLSDSYTQSELDANNIIYNSKLKAAGYSNQAALAGSAAANATNSGYINAASKALTGGAKAYQAYDSVGSGSGVNDYDDADWN